MNRATNMSALHATLLQLWGLEAGEPETRAERVLQHVELTAEAHINANNLHTAGLFNELAELLQTPPQEIHSELAAVQFGHAEQSDLYEHTRAAAVTGAKQTLKRFEIEGKPRNAHTRLLQRLLEAVNKDELAPNTQFPGFCMWFMYWPNQTRPKFLEAGVLSVMHRVAQQYLYEMKQLKCNAPKHDCSLHMNRPTSPDRCMAHVFQYIGAIKPHPKGYDQGACSLFFADWDGFGDWSKAKAGKDELALPDVCCDVVNQCMHVMKRVGFPRALAMCGWSEEGIAQAMKSCGFFPSNAGHDPDHYTGEAPLSFHVHFLWTGPYILGNPKLFDRFGLCLIATLVRYLLSLDLSVASNAKEAFGTACVAACMDPSPWRSAGALKAKGCSKIPKNKSSKPRWQHLNPSSESGEHVLAFKRLVFENGNEGPDQAVAATAMGLLTLPSVISANCLQDMPEVCKANNDALSKQMRDEIVLCIKVLKQVVTSVTGLEPCKEVPMLVIEPKHRKALQEWLGSIQHYLPAQTANAPKPRTSIKRPALDRALADTLNQTPVRPTKLAKPDTPQFSQGKGTLYPKYMKHMQTFDGSRFKPDPRSLSYQDLMHPPANCADEHISENTTMREFQEMIDLLHAYPASMLKYDITEWADNNCFY